eukprot:1326020-Prymnesium_polylepis.1
MLPAADAAVAKQRFDARAAPSQKPGGSNFESKNLRLEMIVLGSWSQTSVWSITKFSAGSSVSVVRPVKTGVCGAPGKRNTSSCRQP